MKNRGQALVEFVLILPVLILFFLAMFDFANIYYQKNQLTMAFNYYHNLDEKNEKEEYLAKNNLKIKKNETEIILKKEIAIITPGLKKMLPDPFVIEERGVYYE